MSMPGTDRVVGNNYHPSIVPGGTPPPEKMASAAR
jgi:hypothetical protein